VTVPRPFDIFYGAVDKEPLWIESAENLENAKARMKDLAAEKPGSYFLFSTAYGKVLAVIDTSRKNNEANERGNGKSGNH
jgi:hypothetical protein